MIVSSLTQEERARLIESSPDLRRLGESPPLAQYLRDLWERREFIITVPLGELRAQNQNTVLGSLWHLLNPLFLAGVFYLVFGVILQARRGLENYPAFLIVGVFTFVYVNKSVMSGTRTIVSNIKLLQSLSFPRASLPLSAVIGEAIAQLPAIVAMLLIVMITGERPAPAWLLIAPVFVLQTFFNLGLAFLVARLTFHFRDVQQLLPYILRIWLYLSGVFFAADFVPEGWMRSLFEVNPAWVFIDLNRLALLHGTTEGVLWLRALGWALPALLGGFFFFRAHESEYGSAN